MLSSGSKNGLTAYLVRPFQHGFFIFCLLSIIPFIVIECRDVIGKWRTLSQLASVIFQHSSSVVRMAPEQTLRRVIQFANLLSALVVARGIVGAARVDRWNRKLISYAQQPIRRALGPLQLRAIVNPLSSSPDQSVTVGPMGDVIVFRYPDGSVYDWPFGNVRRLIVSHIVASIFFVFLTFPDGTGQDILWVELPLVARVVNAVNISLFLGVGVLLVEHHSSSMSRVVIDRVFEGGYDRVVRLAKTAVHPIKNKVMTVENPVDWPGVAILNGLALLSWFMDVVYRPKRGIVKSLRAAAVVVALPLALLIIVYSGCLTALRRLQDTVGSETLIDFVAGGIWLVTSIVLYI